VHGATLAHDLRDGGLQGEGSFMAYQVSREGTIYRNGRVFGKTNNPTEVARRIRGHNKQSSPVRQKQAA